MARSPRATVSKTSGQGVSRLSYQKGYALKGGGATPRVSLSMGSTGDNNDRDYAKGSAPPKESVASNILYGHDEIAALTKAKPVKADVSLERKRK